MAKDKRVSAVNQLEHRARVVMLLAIQEAQRGNHAHVGTGHILLGLIQEERGAAARALKRVGCDLLKARRAVASLLERASHSVIGRVPLSACATQALRLALTESERRGERLICTEHLLMGVLNHLDSVAHQVIERLGLSAGEVTAALSAELSHHVLTDHLDRHYARLLQVGLLVLDQALDAGDIEWARTEVRYLHNLPTLLGEENPERHSYFWNQERAQYLDWINTHGSEAARSRKRTLYEPIWNDMQPLIAERNQIVEQT